MRSFKSARLSTNLNQSSGCASTHTYTRAGQWASLHQLSHLKKVPPLPPLQPPDSPTTVLARVFLQPFIDSCIRSNQKNRPLMLGWDFFFKPGQFPTRFPCRAVQTPALAQKQRQQHCRRLSDRSLRGSVLFQQKVRPIAKYQLQKNLSKLELHTTFPITAGKITGISHLRQ